MSKMDVLELVPELEMLVSKAVISGDDALHFIKRIAQLSIEIKVEKRFEMFAPTVKKWLGAFKTIFRKEKVDEMALRYIQSFCDIFTRAFFTLTQSFYKHEPDFMQELNIHWKEIISGMSAKRRAKAFGRQTQQFKTLVEYLRTAKHRFDQIAVLAVLLLYVEPALETDFNQLKESFNVHLVEKLAVLKTEPTIMNQHAFLHDINAMGRSIISLKATKIICKELSLDLNEASCALWIDYNMMDNSITILGITPTDNKVICFGTVPRPKLKERLSEEHELRIRGIWSILKFGGDPFQSRAIVTVCVPILDRNAVWKAKVKSIFSFVCGDSIFTQMVSESNRSGVTDKRLANVALEERLIGTPSQMDESIAWSQIIKIPITPIAATQLDEDDGQNNVHWKKLSMKEWIEKASISNPSVADNSTDERDNQAVADMPIVQQHSFSDNSTGISFHNNMSVYDDAELEDHAEEQQTIEHMSKLIRNIIGRLEESSPQNISSDVAKESSTKHEAAADVADDEILATKPTQPLTRDISVIDLPHQMSSKPTTAAEVNPNSVPLESCQISTSYKAVQNDTNTTDNYNHNQTKNDQVVSVDPAPNGELELVFDDEGGVYDEHGCVFFNADEIKYAWYVYIENNGLEYLKSETFQAATAEVRKRTEREFKAMHKLICRKFDGDASDLNELINYTTRGTVKRRCSNSPVGITKRPSIDGSVGGSICSNRSNSLVSPEHQLEKQANFDESTEAGCCSSDDNEKCSNVGCKMMPYNDLMGFMAEFAIKTNNYEQHRRNVLALMENLRLTKRPSNAAEILSTTILNMKHVCESARQNAAIILQKTNEQ